MPPPIDPRTTNSLWSSVLAETLHRSGIRHAVISPGSRSTPLTLALAAHPHLEAIPVLDERSAGFFGLGLAKAQGRPVVLVCTSGTAAANYFPAIIEAQESAVPLLVITADRPPEMRACASGQTIDQQKLFGGYVAFYHELAVPEASETMLRYLRQTVAHACARTQRPMGAAVHLNAPFRDPLAPVTTEARAVDLAGRIDWTAFFAQVLPARQESVAGAAPIELPATPRGVIVAGPEQGSDPASYVRQVAELSRRRGWPVLADGLSPLRNDAAALPHLITTADVILRNSGVAGELTPEVVVAVGGWPTSKVLRAWIEQGDAPIYLQSGRIDNRDPLHGRTRPVAALESLIPADPAAASASDYLEQWQNRERRVRDRLDTRLSAMETTFEGKAAWLLAQHLPEATTLFLANSMPVRDVEYFWPPGSRRIRPLCNRGANGIDGTLSTALGVAHAGAGPAVLLTGDLALLHDTNGFLLRPRLRGSLTIVLINNHGGGIFEHLPIAGFEPTFEEFFATPQQADFAALARTYGITHVLVRDWKHLEGLVAELPADGVRMLELRTDRKADAAMRKTWFAELSSEMSAC